MRRRCAGPCGLNRDVKFFTPRGTICVTCRKRPTKDAYLRATYDITLDEYDAIVAAQHGYCPGCGKVPRYPLHVDHDHAVEKLLGPRASVRGGLCKSCNKILRDCRDSIPRLRSLIAYLESPPARKVLSC